MERRGITINEAIVNRCYQRFGNMVQIAILESNDKLAFETYSQALELPDASTIAGLEFEGFRVNGPWHGNSAFTICYKDMKQYILKYLSGSEFPRAQTLLDKVKENNLEMCRFIKPFTIYNKNSKQYMIMPCYACTAEEVMYMSVLPKK